MILIIEY